MRELAFRNGKEPSEYSSGVCGSHSSRSWSLCCQEHPFLVTSWTHWIVGRAAGTNRLLKITPCNKAKANSMHFLRRFAQSKSYSKPILVSPDTLECIHGSKIPRRDGRRVQRSSVTLKARHKCCLLFEVILSTPAQPWQQISRIHKE